MAKKTALHSAPQAQYSIQNTEDQSAMIALWCLRVLRDSRCCRRLVTTERFRDISTNQLMNLLAFNDLPFEDEEDVDLVEFIKQVRKPAKGLIKTLEAAKLNLVGALGDNLGAIAKLLDLNKTEADVLGFYIVLMTNKSLELFLGMLGDMNRREFVQMLAVVLSTKTANILQATSKEGRLYRSGLMRIDNNGANDASRKAELLNGFAELIISEHQSPLNLLSRYFTQCDAPVLNLSNYPHIEEPTHTLLNYLKNEQGKKGINVLVYGEPGTGKTQWVKAVSHALNRELFEINNEDEDGDGVNGVRRVDTYKLAQSVLATQANALIMFDEVEDVFPSAMMSWLMPRSSQPNSKAWMNKLLETNPVPTFWISNAVHQMDSAYLRRFDMVVEISTPPTSVRKSILQNLVADLPVRAEWIDQLAKERSLVPAVMERAIKVAKSVHAQQTNPRVIETEIETLMNATLQAQGKKELLIKNPTEALAYSLNYLNTDLNLEKLVEGIKRREQGRFCLYGLPGTGKTAFGHYVAEQLDKPLIIKRASDLLSPYVGQAERNIAAAFKEARKEGAVLQIDEADSFLQSREKAQRSWEITQVNEMLTQMEAFEGVFIASTNLVKDLDQAAMRRFDVKLKFKPLKPNQAWLLFAQLLKDQDVSDDDVESIKKQIEQLSLLTPGDFAAVKRKFSLGYQDLEPGLVLEALQEECSYKPGYQKSAGIGFLSELKSVF
ncbi:AAA family ATPase [Thiomicrospira microaerophila]|uniref:AAA family ATPase n=1 Tax=Thiomicrospira microaerophila TaxID=406020 RepID=UPI0006963619|nr:AAA family ATPase [Thiomicrospira microaerophila]